MGLYSAYVDITIGGVKDVVIVVPPIKGTMTGPSLAYAYDGKEGKGINLFQEGGMLLFLDDRRINIGGNEY